MEADKNLSANICKASPGNNTIVMSQASNLEYEPY